MQIYENNTHLLGIGCKNFYELNTTVFLHICRNCFCDTTHDSNLWLDDKDIRKEICDVMEGTQYAFEMRAKKYHFNFVE